MKSTVQSYQSLPEAMTKNGQVYQQYKRGTRAIIYMEINPADPPVSFEVIQLRNYPTGIRFGSLAAHTLEKAMVYFDALENDEKPGQMSSKEGLREQEQPKVDQEPTKDPKNL